MEGEVLARRNAYVLSTKPIDRQKATEAVKAAYAAIGLSEPEILFCDNPLTAFREQDNLQKPALWFELWTKLRTQLEGIKLLSSAQKMLGVSSDSQRVWQLALPS